MTTEPKTMDRYGARQRFWAVITSWVAGHISEGQACKLLNVAPVDLRECGDEYNTVADELWARYRETGETIDDDIRAEIFGRERGNCGHGD